jgi:hypothetical protein
LRGSWISCFVLSSATFLYKVAMMSRITLSLRKEGARRSVPLDTHLGSKFPLCFDCQRPLQDIMKPQPSTSSFQASQTRTELFEMQGHTGAFNGDSSAQRQRNSEVRTCFTCSAVAGAFNIADDEHSRYREAIVWIMIVVQTTVWHIPAKYVVQLVDNTLI